MQVFARNVSKALATAKKSNSEAEDICYPKSQYIWLLFRSFNILQISDDEEVDIVKS